MVLDCDVPNCFPPSLSSLSFTRSFALMLPSTSPERMQRFHNPRIDSSVIVGSKTELGSATIMSRYPGTPFKKPLFPPGCVVVDMMSDDFDPYL